MRTRADRQETRFPGRNAPLRDPGATPARASSAPFACIRQRVRAEMGRLTGVPSTSQSCIRCKHGVLFIKRLCYEGCVHMRPFSGHARTSTTHWILGICSQYGKPYLYCVVRTGTPPCFGMVDLWLSDGFQTMYKRPKPLGNFSKHIKTLF